MKNAISLSLALLLLTSCGLLYRGLLGVDTTPQWQDSEDLSKAIKKRNLTDDLVLVLDTASYRNEVISQLKSNIKQIIGDSTNIDTLEIKKVYKIANDDLQSTQIRLFSNDGKELFKLVNCYIDPPIPMNWNVDGCFDVFPPTIAEENLNVHNFDLTYILDNSTKLNGNSITLSDLPKADYYMLVFWNSYMIKPSKKAIKTVKNYIENNPEKSITPIYINNHNAQLWGMMDPTQRKQAYNYEEQPANQPSE